MCVENSKCSKNRFNLPQFKRKEVHCRYLKRNDNFKCTIHVIRNVIHIFNLQIHIYIIFDSSKFLNTENLSWYERKTSATILRLVFFFLPFICLRLFLFFSSPSYPTDTKRNFFINHGYGGCTSDIGWFMMKDFNALSGCAEWDQVTGKSYFLYSGDTTKINWASGKYMSE